MKFLSAFTLTLLALVPAVAQTHLTAAAHPAASFHATARNIEYGAVNGQKLLLDAHVPAGPGPFPVLLIVHGGGWSGGDKETDIVPVLAPFATNFTWFTINYRLAPTNRWPACFDDLQTAIAWVKQHATQYKGDPDRLALVGYSAGAHLVALAGTLAAADTHVQAIVGFAPPTDIVSDARRRRNLDQWTAMVKLLGRHSLDPDTVRLMREISPSEHVTVNLPPFLLVQGDADTTVPYHLTVNFAAKLKANNDPYDFITIPGGQHRLADWSKFDPAWQAKVIAWLNAQLAAK